MVLYRVIQNSVNGYPYKSFGSESLHKILYDIFRYNYLDDFINLDDGEFLSVADRPSIKLFDILNYYINNNYHEDDVLFDLRINSIMVLKSVSIVTLWNYLYSRMNLNLLLLSEYNNDDLTRLIKSYVR